MYAFIILFLVDAYLFMQTPTFAPARKVVEVPPVVASGEQGKYVVYGTMKCGWTRKQLETPLDTRKIRNYGEGTIFEIPINKICLPNHILD